MKWCLKIKFLMNQIKITYIQIQFLNLKANHHTIVIKVQPIQKTILNK